MPLSDSTQPTKNSAIDVVRADFPSDPKELWRVPGFHRPLGGFMQNYSLMLLTYLGGMVLLGYILPQIILPFPEALGFEQLTATFFSFLFTFLDFGVGDSLQRYVAEHHAANPEKALQYIRFFIWFQLITGLSQVTGIAIFSLSWLRETDIAYATWLFIFHSIIQYPGMLGIYKSSLEAFQRFDKSNVVGFVQTTVLEASTRVICILLGRFLGTQNPAMGELMGATIGYILGGYLDDFFAFLLAAHFFRRVLKPLNYGLWDTIRPSFTRVIAKQALTFGIKRMLAPITNQFVSILVTLMVIAWLPNYSTVLGLYMIADGVVRLMVQHLPIQAPIAEAYNRGAKHLTNYMIAGQWKYLGIFTSIFALEIGMLVAPVIGLVAQNYAAASGMIPLLIISRIIVMPIQFSDRVQTGCDKPLYVTYSLWVEQSVRALSYFLLLGVFRLGMLGYLLADLPAYASKLVFAWLLIHKKIIRFKINLWQSFIAPGLALLPFIPINLALVQIFQASASNQVVAILLALVFIVCILVFFPTLLYFPLYAFLGGFDDYGIEMLRLSSLMAGPSKWFARLLFKTAVWSHRHSPLRNRFPIPWEDAHKDAMRMAAENVKSTSKI